MEVFLLTVGVLAATMSAMAIGVIVSNKELKGSCGGPGNCPCEEAERPRECERGNAVEARRDQG